MSVIGRRWPWHRGLPWAAVNFDKRTIRVYQRADRYGKIGISAVAGACQHKGEKRSVSVSRFTPSDSD